MNPALRWLLQTLATGAVLTAALAFLAKRRVGGWIDNRFAFRLEEVRKKQALELENVRQAQATELEGLKHQLAKLSARVAKIHDKEFEILPEVWKKLQNARTQINSFILFPPMYSGVGPDNPDERRHKALEAWNSYSTFILENQFLFEDETSRILKDISDAFVNTVAQAAAKASALQRGETVEYNYPDWNKVRPLVADFSKIMRKRLLVEGD